ncbi:MAG: hypothetical protein JNM51_11760 [Bacteroidia bacterium]|nr:hypothetical protein [Bacteroidia bacterium]
MKVPLLDKFWQLINKYASILFFVILIITIIDRNNRWKDWDEPNGPFEYDVSEYYCYLPYYLLDNNTTTSNIEMQYGKRTLGLPIMYSPFFALGHLHAKLNNTLADGYSKSYQNWIHFGTIVYVLLGLFFIRNILLRHFNEIITALTLLSLIFGTNLFYYTFSFGEMPHSYLFFLYSFFLFSFFKWLDIRKKRFLYGAAFCLGLITLIRVPDIIIVIIPLLYNIKSLSELLNRIRKIYIHKNIFYNSVLFFLIPLVIQLVYWKIHFGHWLHNQYPDEHFYFLDPQFINFLFSFRKGWFIYTPIMIFSAVGLITLYCKQKEYFWLVFIFLILNIYILSSWWDWGYGGSFGSRAMIQSYSLLAIPISSIFNQIWHLNKPFVKWLMRLILIICICFFCYLNFFQSKQFKYNIIHWNGMTKQAYFYIIKDYTDTKQQRDSLAKLFNEPNVVLMKKGLRD